MKLKFIEVDNTQVKYKNSPMFLKLISVPNNLTNILYLINMDVCAKMCVVSATQA